MRIKKCRSDVAFAAIWEDPTPVTTHAGGSHVFDEMKSDEVVILKTEPCFQGNWAHGGNMQRKVQ